MADAVVGGDGIGGNVGEAILDGVDGEALSLRVFSSQHIATKYKRLDIQMHLSEERGGEVALVHHTIDDTRFG